MEPVISTPEVTTVPNTVPKFVFVVPYRDREPHRVFFSTYIMKIMEDVPSEDWTFFFIHQNDKRPFNRGAMKNIGFLALKSAYPDDYKNIIFIFNDVDTLPYDKNVLNYHTEHGVIKHFYGFQFALGGIFSIRGGDFERINGFPNYWAWGGEDNLINQRAKQHGLIIDRSNFYTIGNMKILQFADGLKRLICRDELATSIMPNNSDGLSKLTSLIYTIYNETHMIDVGSFNTYIDYSQLNFEEQSLDKIHKIRVSPLNAMRNIKQLQNDYVVDVNKNIHSIENKTVSDRKIEGGVNTLNMPVQPQMPFMFNNNVGRRNVGLIMPQDRPIVTEESIQNNISGIHVNRMYQNHKQDADIIIPLQRPNTSVGLQGQRRYGMRAMFM
jgi:N-terminal region of glycosyl transferase group 7